MPILIRNMQHHYTSLVVFEDGVVDCWEGLDLQLFKQKLSTGWVATSAPVGARLSVFGLGAAGVDAFEPELSLADVEARVMEAIRHWNPDLVGLVDLEGSADELKGKVRWAKLPALDGVHFRCDSDGTVVLAKSVSAFVHKGDSFRLTRWFVYADGRARLGPEGELVDVGVVEDAVLRGEVVFSIPEASWVLLDGLGRAKMSGGRWPVDPLESIKEQRNHVTELRGGAGAIRVCVEAWREYLGNPTPSGLEVVRKAYLEVPVHLRIYCGDMDTKDFAIRRALGMSGSES